MAETLNFREAVQRAGLSRQRLNEAIKSGRLPASRGGGPGKPTTIQLEDLQAWCASQGLAMPIAVGERLERSQPSAIAEMMLRLDQMFAGMERLERLVEHTLERLERSQAEAMSQVVAQVRAPIHTPPSPERSARAATRAKAVSPDRAQIIARIRHARNVLKKTFPQIAEELNTAAIPTFSGRGQWDKGSVRRFYRGI